MDWPTWSLFEWVAVSLLFVWTGFVRTGLGFGGAALGLPLLLFIYPEPIFWLPIIGTHLLFFSGLTLSHRLHHVDWRYLWRSAGYIVPPALVGVFGLVTLPAFWLNLFIYTVALLYGFMWAVNYALKSDRPWLDKLWLMLGGYVAGTSLTGAPLMVAVFMQHVAKVQLRDTLFVLWFVLVSIKMVTFLLLSVDLHVGLALALIPIAAIGHVLGLRAHDFITQNDARFKQWVGSGLVLVSAAGLLHLVL